MALKIFPSESPAEQRYDEENTPAMPKLVLRERIQKEAEEKHIALSKGLLTDEEMLLYDAAINNTLAHGRLTEFGNRLKESAYTQDKNSSYAGTLENRKRFFAFIMQKTLGSPERWSTFLEKAEQEREAEEKWGDEKEKKLSYARETLMQFTEMEREKKISSGHFLETDFVIDDLSKEDLSIWLSIIDRTVSREKFMEYTKNVSRGQINSSRQTFVAAIRNIVIPMFDQKP